MCGISCLVCVFLVQLINCPVLNSDNLTCRWDYIHAYVRILLGVDAGLLRQSCLHGAAKERPSWEQKCRLSVLLRMQECTEARLEVAADNDLVCRAFRWKCKSQACEAKGYELLCAAAEQLRGVKKAPYTVECTVSEVKVRDILSPPYNISSIPLPREKQGFTGSFLHTSADEH